MTNERADGKKNGRKLLTNFNTTLILSQKGVRGGKEGEQKYVREASH